MSFSKNIKLLTWFNFFTDFRLYSPIAIIYFSQVTHSYALGASIFSITYIVSALFDIPTGIYSDKIGRKNTIILGAAFAVGYSVFYATGINYWFLAIGAVCEGLSRAFYSGNNQALLHNMLSEEGLEHEFHIYSGKLSSMFQIALAASGLLGGIIAFRSFPLVMWISVIPQVICLLISLQIIDSKKLPTADNNPLKHLRESCKAFIHNGNLRLLTIAGILSYGFGETAYQFQAAFYNALLPLWAVGIAKTLSNVFAAISFYLSGKIIDRFGSVKTLLLNDIYSIGANIVALLGKSVFSPFVMASTSALFGASSTAWGTLMQKEFTDEQRATMSSLSSFGWSIFYAVFAFVTGIFADKFGIVKALFLIQLLSVVIIWLHWKLTHLDKVKIRT